MTGAELVTTVVQDYDNASAADVTNPARRARILRYGQMVLGTVWNWKDWPFKFALGTVTCTNGEGSLPADFGRLGPNGLLWEDSPRKAWTEVHPVDLVAAQKRGEAMLRWFSVAANAGDGVLKLLIPDTGTRTLSLYYEVQRPELLDDGTEIAGIPVDYHETVLLAGTIARTQVSKNDVREFWKAEYAMGLARMVANLMPLTSRVKQLPTAVGGLNC